MCTAYEATLADHKRITRKYAQFAKHPYRTLRGGKITGWYRPDKLPRALPSFADALDFEGESPPPAQRALVMVQHHKRWLEALKARRAQDREEPNDVYANREQVRFVSASQPDAGAMLDISPDGTFLNTFADMDFEVYLQRRGSLSITSATGLFDALEKKGEAVDRKGDGLSCGGEYSWRHHRVLRRGVAMTRAVAIGQVVQGDKERPELTDMINSTCAVDLAELEGDDATGADVCQEYKVVSPLTKTHRTGRGSKVHGGSVANVGHLYAFGNTEERYRIKILGCKGRGRLGKDPPFNHATGVGSVKARPGDYFDALRNKKAIVVPMILEAQGGIAPHSLHFIRRLAQRAKGARGRDGTVYGRSRTSARSFFKHHTQQLAAAAQVGDAKGIRRKITQMKIRLMKDVLKAGGRA